MGLTRKCLTQDSRCLDCSDCNRTGSSDYKGMMYSVNMGAPHRKTSKPTTQSIRGPTVGNPEFQKNTKHLMPWKNPPAFRLPPIQKQLKMVPFSDLVVLRAYQLGVGYTTNLGCCEAPESVMAVHIKTQQQMVYIRWY